VEKEKNMKLPVCLLIAALLILTLPVAHAQEYGKIRALQQRATYVTKLKNDFVARVLTSYNIPHQRNDQGVVIRINMEGQWQDVSKIEIIPVLKASADKRQSVAAHDLYFYTADGILDLVAELTIK
jgi:hypothetical protein